MRLWRGGGLEDEVACSRTGSTLGEHRYAQRLGEGDGDKVWSCVFTSMFINTVTTRSNARCLCVVDPNLGNMIQRRMRGSHNNPWANSHRK